MTTNKGLLSKKNGDSANQEESSANQNNGSTNQDDSSDNQNNGSTNQDDSSDNQNNGSTNQDDSSDNQNNGSTNQSNGFSKKSGGSVNLNHLTAKQKKVYYCIETFLKEKNIPPTVREIGEMIGEKTPGSVQGILNRLEQKEVIKRQVGMARSIQLVSEDSYYETPIYLPKIKKISDRNISDLFSIYNIVKYCPISPSFINSHKNTFIFSCNDNSLAENGIKEGDLLFVNPDSELNNGDVVVVLYNGNSYLRYYYKNNEKNSITLKADSNLLGKEVFNKNEVTIVGKMVGRYMKY